MAVSADDVARELRRRVPGLASKKLHKFLYYCQGHHLAGYGVPLFTDTISAWDMGPVVGSLWHREKNDEPCRTSQELDEAQLNTVGHVLSRYGGLTGTDLQHLTHHEWPYQAADAGRPPGSSARIEVRLMQLSFTSVADDDAEPGEVPPDTVEVQELLAGAHERAREPRRPDSVEELRTRLETSGQTLGRLRLWRTAA